MSNELNVLEELIQPRKLETQGVNWHQHQLCLKGEPKSFGPQHIRLILDKVFNIKNLRGLSPITVWYDEMDSCGNPDHYQSISPLRVIGVFYTSGAYGADVMTHFFIRNFKEFHGPLDIWRQDLRFPSETRKFSAFACYPRGFELSERGKGDPHNHAVTTYHQEKLDRWGIDLDLIVAYMTAPEFEGTSNVDIFE